jgi:hypothetical protein
MTEGMPTLRSGPDALAALERLRPQFHPDPAKVAGALENQFAGGPRAVEGAGGASYAIGVEVLRFLAALPPSQGASIETGCGHSTVVLANVFATHISVNPDLASNRLVREFVELNCGTTGLRHVESSSDQGLPGLVAEGCRVELALIDGNHSHPFPLLDFHYVDQMLAPDGLLLVDNTEIPAVQELTEYLEFEGAYQLEGLLTNCAVYRKVKDRQLGWRGQTIRGPSAEVDAVRKELAQLRMEVAPELRASLSGANPLPGWPEAGKVPHDAGRRRKISINEHVRLPAPGNARLQTSAARLYTLARWYMSPSGALAGAGLLLLAVGVAAPGLWRLIGIAGIAALAVFFPYRFLREQRRTDRLVDEARATAANGVRRLEAVDHRLDRIVKRVDEVEWRVRPSRRFAAPRPKDPRKLELTMREATSALHLSPDPDKSD